MTATELAKNFKVSVTSCTRWESGTEPTLEMVVSLANFFKVTLDELLTKEITPADVPPRYGARRVEKLDRVEEPNESYSTEEAKLIRVLTEKIDNLESRLISLEQATPVVDSPK